MKSRPFLDYSPLTRASFTNHFWTAQVIAGTTLALKLYPVGKSGDGTIWQGLHAALTGFVAVIPCAAVVTYVYLRFSKSDPIVNGQGRTRWLGATVVALILCLVVVGGGQLGRHYFG